MAKRILIDALLVLAVVCLVLALVFVSASAQNAALPTGRQAAASARNAVPPTARQAAALPQYAGRLAGANKSQAPAPSHNTAGSPQNQILYENGPANGTTDAWTINFGFIVSDSFYLSAPSGVGGFDFWAWEYPGDVLSSVDWSITTSENAPCPGTQCLGFGTASGNNVVDQFISTNQFGFDVDQITVTGLNVPLGSGTVWLNLANAVVPSGLEVYWDENSGAGCHSPGCPSMASENMFGTIPSESFDIEAGSTTYTYTLAQNRGGCTWTISGPPLGFGFHELTELTGPPCTMFSKTWDKDNAPTATVVIEQSGEAPTIWHIVAPVQDGYSATCKTTATLLPPGPTSQRYDLLYKQSQSTPVDFTTKPGTWMVNTSAAPASKGRQPGRSAPDR